jgi:hypothetical protein
MNKAMGKELNITKLSPDLQKQMLVISAESAGFEAGNFAKIMLNGRQVQVEANENDDHRGLHLVVFNPKSGAVEAAKAFDTYESSAALDGFIG